MLSLAMENKITRHTDERGISWNLDDFYSDGHSFFINRVPSTMIKTTALIEHLIANGTDSLVVCGTTGESPTLSARRKRRTPSFTIETVNKRIPVIAGTGTNSTAESIANTIWQNDWVLTVLCLLHLIIISPIKKGCTHTFHILPRKQTSSISVQYPRTIRC